METHLHHDKDMSMTRSWETERRERVAGLEASYQALEAVGIGVNNPTHTAWAKYAVAHQICFLTKEHSATWAGKASAHLTEALRLQREP